MIKCLVKDIVLVRNKRKCLVRKTLKIKILRLSVKPISQMILKQMMNNYDCNRDWLNWLVLSGMNSICATPRTVHLLRKHLRKHKHQTMQISNVHVNNASLPRFSKVLVMSVQEQNANSFLNLLPTFAKFLT